MGVAKSNDNDQEGRQWQRLTSTNASSRPSTSLWNNYQSEIVDAEACTGCGACEKACTWGVIKAVGGKAVLPGDRYLCMGCGLCVSQCPAGAVRLMRKDDELLYEPPVDSFAAHELWHEHHVAAR